jgi:hypothetical protein
MRIIKRGCSLNEGLLRQRRNLILANLVMLLLCLANVKIEKFSILGITFSFIENYNLAYQFLWAIWFYFLYRYFVYFLEYAPSALKKYWGKELEKVVNPVIKRIAYKEHSGLTSAGLYSYAFLKRDGWLYSGQKTVSRLNDLNGKVEHSIENIQMPIKRKSVFLYEIYGGIRFLLITPAVTDYIFALAFSVVVLITSLAVNWSGSLTTLFT